ncbi:MAG: DUF484 family protein [Gammaproteobacteria bacterium]|nr:DUF484 family protein [Gammaproteobacteria bacterium]
MSSPSQPDAPSSAPVDAADVVAYLRRHPAFLVQHPQLLSELSIPHETGATVSLVERQVGVLRDENARQKKQLDDLIRHARHNEQLTRKIHSLVLTLMNAVGPQAIFTCLDRGLCADFGAERVECLIFAESAALDAQSLAPFVGAEAPARTAFAPVLGARSSACGMLEDAQREAFDATFKGSAVVMPLLGQGWDGVIVCASNDAGRYSPDMGTELLDYLREVATLLIAPWVKRKPQA